MKSILVALLLISFANSAFAATLGEWNLEGTMFPLEEKVTLKVLTSGNRGGYDVKEISQNKDWQSLLAALNLDVEFEFIGDFDAASTRDNLQMRLLSGEYGDMIYSFEVNTLNNVDIADLASAGIVIPITKYMNNPEVMPNAYRVLVQNNPDLLNNMKFNDGEIYSLQGFTQLNAYTAGEAMMMVNMDWLASWQTARNVDHVPQNLAEFEDMLCYFRDSDLNGNGMKDEIPYFMAQRTYMGCMTLEHAMGMFGIATKDSTADMNIMISDEGKCYYVHTTDEYKEALKVFSGWYEDGLIWDEIFTANDETLTAVVAEAPSKIGVYNACEDIDGFEVILPPEIEGYQARYHMHPATRLGVRQSMGVITNTCKNPEVAAAFLDLLYNFDNYMMFTYGSYGVENNLVTLNEQNQYVVDPSSAQAMVDLDITEVPINQILAVDYCHSLDNFNMDLDNYFGDSARVRGYQLYAENNVWNPTGNLWPRCAMSEDISSDYSFLYTDVSTTLAEYRAKFITGEYDVDEKWDEFQQKLVKLGIEDMTKMIQDTYDAWVNK